MLADETVEANEMLSVDMFLILKRLFCLFSCVISLGAMVVLSVCARLTELPNAAGLENGGDGVARST